MVLFTDLELIFMARVLFSGNEESLSVSLLAGAGVNDSWFPDTVSIMLFIKVMELPLKENKQQQQQHKNNAHPAYRYLLSTFSKNSNIYNTLRIFFKKTIEF